MEFITERRRARHRATRVRCSSAIEASQPSIIDAGRGTRRMNLLTSSILSYLRGAAAATTLVATLAAGGDPAVAKPDLYIIAMSHQPEFCFQHQKDGYAGCQHPIDYWKTHLTIHGMWPEYKDGSWPSMCTREPLNKEVIDELKEGLNVYWPNVKEDLSDPEHDEFWRHEWSKHGTCSGLSQKEYFLSALKYSLPTPDLVQHGSAVDKAALLEAYGGADKVVAVCAGKGKFLSEVRSCLAVGDNGLPQGQIPCPKKALEENNCGDSIIISKFPRVKKSVERNLRGSVELIIVE